MRWTPRGAEAILKLRAVDLTGGWDRFWVFPVAQEKRRRWGGRHWKAVGLEEGQELAFHRLEEAPEECLSLAA